MRHFLDVCRGTLWREVADDVFERLEGFAERGSGEIWVKASTGHGGPDWKAFGEQVGQSLVNMARQMWQNKVNVPGGHSATATSESEITEAAIVAAADEIIRSGYSQTNGVITLDALRYRITGIIARHVLTGEVKS